MNNTQRQINLAGVIHNHDQSNKEKTRDRPLKLVGCINKYGWEVYEGINLNSSDEVDLLNKELEFITTDSTHLSQMWNGIGGTRRKILKISDLDAEKKNVLHSTYDNITKFYDKVEEELLSKIPYLANVNLETKSVIANFGLVHAQLPHRDSSARKKM